MLLSEIKRTVTVSGGSGFLSIPCWQGAISIVSIVPSSTSYQYNFRITNLLGVDIEAAEDNTGSYLDNTKRLTIRGNATLYLETASNGDYEIYVQIIEKN